MLLLTFSNSFCPQIFHNYMSIFNCAPVAHLVVHQAVTWEVVSFRVQLDQHSGSLNNWGEKCCLCYFICKWLDLLVFSDKDDKPKVPSHNSLNVDNSLLPWYLPTLINVNVEVNLLLIISMFCSTSSKITMHSAAVKFVFRFLLFSVIVFIFGREARVLEHADNHYRNSTSSSLSTG